VASETLNLSVANLRFVDVTLFTSLTELNISHNMVGDKTTRLDLSMLLQLTGLDVSHNLIDADMLASLGLEAMLDLRVLRVNHNQLYVQLSVCKGVATAVSCHPHV